MVEIVLLNNTRRIQSSGINRAVEQYGDLAPFIIRVDAHADYPAGFCETLLAAQEMTGAEFGRCKHDRKGRDMFPESRGCGTEFEAGQRRVGPPQVGRGTICGSWPSRPDEHKGFSLRRRI